MKGNLSKLLLLKGLYFDWNDDEFTTNYLNGIKGTSIGFVAQEVEEVLPDVVERDPQGVMGVEYDIMSVIALGALQEQHTRILMLKDRINNLKELVD